MPEDEIGALQQTREHIHEAIQESASFSPELEGAVLTGYVVICEWSKWTDTDGEKWLTAVSSQGAGEKPAPGWVWQGWLHNSLFGRFLS